ncbi:hypothetical protein OPV22_001795 [Ensete ventricosum]|uniref:Secreted protein n=1 Tax=Ensete ventricosum TaxID=4639 RepID=A0AAV8RSW4_ENSVE|nr:hypothetical protein OPV22_001795 [Ensete ventricosum]
MIAIAVMISMALRLEKDSNCVERKKVMLKSYSVGRCTSSSAAKALPDDGDKCSTLRPVSMSKLAGSGRQRAMEQRHCSLFCAFPKRRCHFHGLPRRSMEIPTLLQDDMT